MRLEESVGLAGVKVEGGWLRGVLLCGKTSKNGREYTDAAFKEALPLYEGANIYVNHGKKGPRLAEDHYARVHNPRMSPEGPRGDIQLLESHPMTPRIKEDLEKQLGFFSLSHVADGEVKTRGGKQIVESIKSIQSVDLVTGAATTRSLSEQDMVASGDGAGGMEAFGAAVSALLGAGAIDKDTFLTKAGELWDTLMGDGGAAPEGASEPPAAPAAEQQLTAKVAQLEEQLKKLSAARYTKPKTGSAPLHEQATTPAIPEEPQARAAWLRS